MYSSEPGLEDLRRRKVKRNIAMTRRTTEAKATPAISSHLPVDDGLVETVGVEDDDDAVDDMVVCGSVSRRNMKQKDDARIAGSLTTYYRTEYTLQQ